MDKPTTYTVILHGIESKGLAKQIAEAAHGWGAMMWSREQDGVIRAYPNSEANRVEILEEEPTPPPEPQSPAPSLPAPERSEGPSPDLAAENSRLRAEVQSLREALADAVEGMEDMVGYVGEYFREKWGHDDYIERAKAKLGAGAGDNV